MFDETRTPRLPNSGDGFESNEEDAPPPTMRRLSHGMSPDPDNDYVIEVQTSDLRDLIAARNKKQIEGMRGMGSDLLDDEDFNAFSRGNS